MAPESTSASTRRNRFGRCPEPPAPVHDHDLRSDRVEAERPVEGGIAAAGDDHPLAPVVLPAGHQIGDRSCVLVGFDPGKRGSVGSEGATSCRDHHGLAPDGGSGRCADTECAGMSINTDDLLAEVVDRREWCGLAFQLADQFLGLDHRQRRNVIDRLFRIECRALATDGIQCIDHMAAHVEHPRLEHLEQADGSGSHYDNVGLVLFAHHRSLGGHHPAPPATCRRRHSLTRCRPLEQPA